MVEAVLWFSAHVLAPAVLLGFIVVAFLMPGRTPRGGIPGRPDPDRTRFMAVLGSSAGLLLFVLAVRLLEVFPSLASSGAGLSAGWALCTGSVAGVATRLSVVGVRKRSGSSPQAVSLVCMMIVLASALGLLGLTLQGISRFVVAATLSASLAAAAKWIRHPLPAMTWPDGTSGASSPGKLPDVERAAGL